MSDQSTMIAVQGLVKTYGARPVLRKLDLEIARGTCVALLGANGSGKTTLIRILAGLSRASSGQVTIGGWRLPKEAAQIRAHIGYLGHQPLLYNDLTAAENLRFFGSLYALPDVNIADALARVGLGKRAHDLVAGFSRGMQQRLGIARALLHAPDVILFDEPFTGLDVDGARLLDGIIAEQRASGHTLIMTTHDLESARLLCDRLLILSRGRVVYDQMSAAVTLPELVAAYASFG